MEIPSANVLAAIKQQEDSCTDLIAEIRAVTRFIRIYQGSRRHCASVLCSVRNSRYRCVLLQSPDVSGVRQRYYNGRQDNLQHCRTYCRLVDQLRSGLPGGISSVRLEANRDSERLGAVVVVHVWVSGNQRSLELSDRDFYFDEDIRIATQRLCRLFEWGSQERSKYVVVT